MRHIFTRIHGFYQALYKTMPGLKVIGLLHVLEQRQLTRQIVSAANFQRTEKSSRLVFPLNLDGIIIL